MPTSSQPLPALFVPHGAPTLALEPGAAGAALTRFAATLPRPRAIVVVSAHWQAERPTVGYAEAPETLHDFHGFPPELYRLRYPARGDQAVTSAVLRALQEAGLQAASEPDRGLDHGAWTPLMLMYPEADIPVVPLSLLGGRGAREHLALGRALRGLLDQGVLILASGNLTHNLADFRLGAATGGEPLAYVDEFAAWIHECVERGDDAALVDYRQRAPAARRAHPSEEHLLPLFVALGAGGPHSRRERFHAGVDHGILAMDAYAFRPARLS
ncbi:MAG: dioxygenase [Azonexus sp.]|jgi:4,5-DOPA dioxygenase extradiol|nr:dioxygenase [Betaproteobacteria bacterium]MBK8917655.1 dioxygenase [Betaproteobacteria bacterium]MBP6037063.1 dioxygenase [Azonexus sp.]MBP6907528.1 dioxygenase [Azonexus sp.]